VTALILAKAAGAVTIITSSSDEKLEYVKDKYGAHFTINYKKTFWNSLSCLERHHARRGHSYVDAWLHHPWH
jgi:NADPH:quinone reductase-like Zn-dependent oxidoreductase